MQSRELRWRDPQWLLWLSHRCAQAAAQHVVDEANAKIDEAVKNMGKRAEQASPFYGTIA